MSARQWIGLGLLVGLAAYVIWRMTRRRPGKRGDSGGVDSGGGASGGAGGDKSSGQGIAGTSTSSGAGKQGFWGSFFDGDGGGDGGGGGGD